MGKRSAQAHGAGGVRDQSRMAATQHEARGAAREPDGGTPGRYDGSEFSPMEHNVVKLASYQENN